MSDSPRNALRAAQAAMDARLGLSGLNKLDARSLHLEAVTNANLLDASFTACAALKLPYFAPDGHVTSFYRVRYLEDTRNGFDTLTEKKALRYAQQPGSLNEVYLPPLVKGGWDAILQDAEVALIITEGELKSAAGCKAGVPTMGLGGVWCFKSNRKRLPLLPVFYSTKWKGRLVYILYDSDARANPDVAAAQAALARELAALGAQPFIVDLPSLSEEGKTGLDDYLVAEGSGALKALLEAAEPYAPVAALHALNEEVAYVRDPGIVVVVADGRKLLPGAFTAHAYANRYFHEERAAPARGSKDPKAIEVRLVKTPLAPAWLAWEQRAELARLTYKPGEEKITPQREYNYWTGWGCEPRKGDITPWVALLDYLFAGNPKARKWFECWCAAPIQTPGLKMFSAAVLWGIEQGTGKSLVGYTLGRIYGRNFTEINDQDLHSSFNEWAEARQFVLADDVTGGENKRVLADRLKAMISRRELRLNPKYIPSYVVPDCINYYFTSNHPDAFFVEDTDRRYFIHEVITPPLALGFYRAYDRWLWKDTNGASALFYHLLHLPLGDFDPTAPALDTAAKTAMREDGRSDLGTWCARLRADPDGTLKLGDAPLPGDLFSPQELLQLYDPERRGKVTSNGMGRELRRVGIRPAAVGMPIKTRLGQVRLYAVRNSQQWAQAYPADCAKEYERHRAAMTDHHRPKKF